MSLTLGPVTAGLRHALRTSILTLLLGAGLASAATYDPAPRELGVTDFFLYNRAVQMKACVEEKTCRLSLVNYETSEPYLAFMVQQSVWEKFQAADKELFTLGAGHLLLKINKKPLSALKDTKYGGAGLSVTDDRIPEYESNIKSGLRAVKFYVVSEPFDGEVTRFVDVPSHALAEVEEMNYFWVTPAVAPAPTTEVAPDAAPENPTATPEEQALVPN